MHKISSSTYSIIFCVVSFLFPKFAISKISLTQKENPPIWELRGSISKEDVKEVARAIEISNNNKTSLFIRLNTPGGDVESAIEIGRQLRKARAIAITYSEGKCYSSCIYVLAGAVRRQLSNSIGIHRPYSSNISQRDYQAIQTENRRIAKISKEFFEEMNISPTLYDDMVSIPPEDIKMLDEAALKKYGMLTLDPVEQELDDAREARKYEITKAELLIRKSRANDVCNPVYLYGTNTGDFSQYTKCLEKVFSGNN